MALAAQQAQETVQLQHTYKATPEQVFTAWCKPEALGQWFGPHSHRCKVEKFDFTEGGQYQIRMIPIGEDADCEGDSTQDSICAGEFVEIIENQRIVMSFDWIENGAPLGDSLLTIELEPDGDGTKLTLIHERLPDEQIRNAHASGWQGSLECLQDYLSAN
ncbi:MAG: SRPBCC domain-containing protein [Gammaproteobacteria bacterium]|nr:SRPBCC domain-containing protein [Gammaproteobacteria bacterium]